MKGPAQKVKGFPMAQRRALCSAPLRNAFITYKIPLVFVYRSGMNMETH